MPWVRSLGICVNLILPMTAIDYSFFFTHVDQLHILMIDIYAEMNYLEKMQMILRIIEQPNRMLLSSLIKAYGKCQHPELAEALVRTMIKNPRYRNPDISTINCLLNAWADAAFTHPHCAERALKVFQWLFDDPDVVALNLQPTVVTYSTLLKCLASSGFRADEIRQNVEMIVTDMENRYKMGNMSCQPNEIFFALVIRAYLSANDYQQAEAILQRMEQQCEPGSSEDIMVRPNIRTYSEFLMFYSRLGTVSAAEKTAQIHDRMRKLSQTTDPSLKPNVYTYNMVLNGWALSNDSSAGDQMWKVYEQMANVDHLALDKYNYNTLLAFYSKSKRLVDVPRSMQLLQAMRNSHNTDDHPQNNHYEMVLRTCMNSGAVESAVEVMLSFVKVYTSGKCRMNDKPNPKFYPWIVTSLLQSDDLFGATRFVLDSLCVCRDKKVLSEFGLVLDLVLQLRQAWTNSNHVDKDNYIDQLDSIVIAVVR
jgi:Pentacotripeptide-repeat region of PRORP/PPR repeat